MKNVKQPPVILVIEDEELLLRAIIKKLSIKNMKYVAATTGKQALDYLMNFDQLPNAIWLDYYLRDMNGLEFIRKLKKKKQWVDIPIIIVSNSASSEKVHNMLALGANKYLLKAQYRLDEIIDVIKLNIARPKI